MERHMGAVNSCAAHARVSIAAAASTKTDETQPSIFQKRGRDSTQRSLPCCVTCCSTASSIGCFISL